MKKHISLIFIGLITFISNAENEMITQYNPKNRNNFLNAKLQAHTLLRSGSNIGLLNAANDFDNAFFVQSIINLGLTIQTPEESQKRKLEFHLTSRANTVLGSPETTQMVTPDITRIGHTITEFEHSHAFDRPLFWIQKAWMKIFSDSKKSFIQCGYFPKQIGLGLILGNGYRMGNPLLTNSSDLLIDQYRPGFQFHTKLKNEKYSLTGYLGIQHVNTTSIGQQIGMIRSQELQENIQSRFLRKEKSPFQNTFLISLESNIPIDRVRNERKNLSVDITPFILYRYDPNETVEFFADASSRVFTLGTSCNFTYKKFFGTVDFAAQLGRQQVKAWDRNVAIQEGTKSLTHLFKRPDAATAWATSAVFPTNQDTSLSYDSGTEFAATFPTETTLPGFNNFKNSYSRFRKAYRNNLSGILLAADCGYDYSRKVTFGGIVGLISGDQNPNDSAEKIMLHRLDSSWNSVRQDKQHHHFGFQGINSLYTGNNVKSYYLLKSNRLANSGTTIGSELTPNSCSNLGYLGFSMKYEKAIRNSEKSYFIQPNIIFMLQTSRTTFGYDPTTYDTYSPATILPSHEKFASALKKMPLTLGTELNAKFEFYDNENLSLFGSCSFFFPGAHYNELKEFSYQKLGKVIPLKNQLAGEKNNISGIETDAQNRITLLDNTSMYCHIGCSINFDSIIEFFTAPKRGRKKKKIMAPKFRKK